LDAAPKKRLATTQVPTKAILTEREQYRVYNQRSIGEASARLSQPWTWRGCHTIVAIVTGLATGRRAAIQRIMLRARLLPLLQRMAMLCVAGAPPAGDGAQRSR